MLKFSLYLQLKIWLLFLFSQSDRRGVYPGNVGRMERISAVAIERGLSFNELSEQIGKGLIPLGPEESN